MWKYFTHKNTYRYVDVLKDLVDSYNATPHSAIKGRTTKSVNEQKHHIGVERKLLSTKEI